MQKFLLGMCLILLAQTSHATLDEQCPLTDEELVESINIDFLRCKPKKSKDILASLIEKPLQSSQGADILPTGEIRSDFQFTLEVLTADFKLLL